MLFSTKSSSVLDWERARAMPPSECDRFGVAGCDAPRAGYGEVRRLRRVVLSAPGVPGVGPGLSAGISMAAGLDACLATGDTAIGFPPSSGETAMGAPLEGTSISVGRTNHTEFRAPAPRRRQRACTFRQLGLTRYECSLGGENRATASHIGIYREI